MSKKTLSNGVALKVENRSGFDKSFFNCLTTGVGTITPIVKQLMLPNSTASLRLKISAQLPPLAADAFLRTHLKVEAFAVPLRLCYGGFESFFCGREVWDSANQVYTRAKLPRWTLIDRQRDELGIFESSKAADWKLHYGAGSLLDYFGVYVNDSTSAFYSNVSRIFTNGGDDTYGECFNIFPMIAYQLVYDEYYRNKLIETPLFSTPAARGTQGGILEKSDLAATNLPYIAATDIIDVVASIATDFTNPDLLANANWIPDQLPGTDFNGGPRTLCGLRQRNYGDDYFTAATAKAQEGNPVEVVVTSNKFTISALRMQNALQEFAEVNNYASPDYIQTLTARYGASMKYGVAQKPILLGSADFPMYTSGVEQTAGTSNPESSSFNPFTAGGYLGARAGRGHAEGTDFVCKFDVDEPCYLIVNATLVPEAQYYQGVARDMMLFNDEGSLVDLPTGLLEHIGNDPISSLELYSLASENVFGYVQRYLWHKLGNRNQVHGLMRMDQSLGAFAVQRSFASRPSINTSFLKVKRTDLDNVAAVSSGISSYGVMIDSAIELFVSEPLAESAIPALSNPAREHGRSVYVKTGGSKLA